MYSGRMMDELTDVPLPEWDMNELSHQHLSLSRMAPFLNQQGIHLHQRIIREIPTTGRLTMNIGSPFDFRPHHSKKSSPVTEEDFI